MTDDPKQHFFSNDGLSLSYWEWGDPSEDTLVLVHGIRDQARSWDVFRSALLSRRVPFKHVVALDLRGHGSSEWPKTGRGYQHEDFLFDLAGFLRHLSKHPVTIVGHSLGGSMALLYAGVFPAKVHKLVLIESLGPFGRSDEEVPDLMAERLEGKDYIELPFPYPSLEAAAKALHERFPLIPYDTCIHMARYGTRGQGGYYLWKYDPVLRYRTTTALSEGQIKAFIERVACPILFVYGTKSDFMASVRGARVELFKNAEIKAIEGAGHHVPHEKPEELAEIVSPFLTGGRKHERRSPPALPPDIVLRK